MKKRGNNKKKIVFEEVEEDCDAGDGTEVNKQGL
jgi:hypothetical protein